MRILTALFFIVTLPLSTFADDHANQSTIAGVWECELNEGVTAVEVATWGASKYKKWTEKNDMNHGSYLWEAVAVNPPFDEPDLRWVDYYPSWEDYYVMRDGWQKEASLEEDWASMVTCGKARFAVAMSSGSNPVAKEKPLVANVCQLNDGKTLQDAMTFLPKATEVINETVGTEIMSFTFTNFIGVSGPDYIAFFTGETSDMVKVMDGVKDGVYANAFAKAGLESPSDCTVDLHSSREMVRSQD